MPKNRISKSTDQQGRYSYQITDVFGKRHSLKSRKNETFSAFRKRCEKLDEEIEQIAITGSRTETFDELFWMWHEGYVVPNLSNSSANNTKHLYMRHIKPWLAKRRISDITRADAYQVLTKAQKRGLSASTIKKIRSCISRPYNWAINSLGYRLVPPTQGLVFRMKDTGPDKSAKVISPQDLDRFLEAAKSSKYCNYFRVLAFTGLRPSEALGLQAQDVKDDVLEIRRSITVHDGAGSGLKTPAAYREIPLTAELRKILNEQIRKTYFVTQEHWLFPASSGEDPNMDMINSAFLRVRKRTEVWEIGGETNRKKIKKLTPAVDCSLYSFRHTFATRMAEAGMHQKVLQEIMGHSDITITLQYYVGVTDTMIEDAKSKMSMMSKNIADKIAYKTANLT